MAASSPSRAIASHIPRPEPGEYASFYGRYIDGIAGLDVAALLQEQLTALDEAFSSMSEGDAAYRYAPGKWSVKEVIGHLGDTERVLSYRAFAFSRNEPAPLPGFDESAYVAAAGFDRRTLASLLEELRRVRAATIALFQGIDPDAWTRRGIANNAEVTVRALASIIPGHLQHHLRIFDERYGIAVRIPEPR